MRVGGNSILVLLLTCLLCCDLRAQVPYRDRSQKPDPVSPASFPSQQSDSVAPQISTPLPADSLVMKTTRARLWDQSDNSVAELNGPVQIELNHTTMAADNAVVWIGPNPNGPPDSHRLQIALIGKVRLQQEGVLRLDQKLLVKAVVTGNIQLVGERAMGSDETSTLFQQADALRTAKPTADTTSPATTTATTGTIETTQPATTQSSGATTLSPLDNLNEPLPAIATQPTGGDLQPIHNPVSKLPRAVPQPHTTLEFDGDFDRAVTSDGKLAAVFSNGVNLRYLNEKGDLLEFVSRSAVLFTNLTQLKGAGAGEDKKHFVADHVISAYFEGDVQIYVTPSTASRNELRMRAERVYYELATDRAVMTDVLFHTVDLAKQIPIFMRASKVRQLSMGEFKVEGMELSSSAFATPTYSLAASNAYVRGVDTGDPAQGERVSFEADNAVIHALGVPIFYFPAIGGTVSTKGSAFRQVDIVDDSQYGDGIRTRWGLLETLGQVPPKDLDISYTLDYMSKRGVSGGIDAAYSGGFVSDTTRQPWNFLGDLHSYFVDDHGTDVLGAARIDEKPDDEFRGRLYFEHQHFFPDGWQAEIRLGYISDSNFMAQWFNDEYQNGLPVDESFHLMHTNESEVFSFLAEGQPNRAISVADEEQQNAEISRLPEISYDRVGDSLLGDHLTFFGENSGSALKFVRNTQTLAQQGFYTGTEPGLPSYAYTGDPGSTTYRGDFREEIDFPINAGPVKVVPYAFGRYTGYSQGVIAPNVTPQNKSLIAAVQTSGGENRFMGGVGARVMTDFWKVDDSVESDMFDLHRLRHIVEPELNVFASSSNLDQDRVFVYDPEIDAVNDVEAVQLALHQRWQTKRGGPGKWRSVDFFTLNLYGNFFANQPQNRFRDPTDFRGIFYYSMPEASVPRNSANADATWRISDTMAVLSDVEENLDKVRLATASVGVAVQRDARLSYFVGTRYIADLHSNIITFQIQYQLDRKYSLSATESLDLAQNKDVFYTFALTRAFDNFSIAANLYYDQSTNDKGFSFSFQPLGAHGGLGSSQLQQPTN